MTLWNNGEETQALKHLKLAGFGSAIVIVACWTVCQTCGLDAGPSAHRLPDARRPDSLMLLCIWRLSWCLGNVHMAGAQKPSTGARCLQGPSRA